MNDEQGAGRLAATRINRYMHAASERIWERLMLPALEAFHADNYPPGVELPTLEDLAAMPEEERAGEIRSLLVNPYTRAHGLQLLAAFLGVGGPVHEPTR